MYDPNNIFAKILRNEISCDIVYEDKNVLFFNDIYPQAKIHILGIPKIEVVDYCEFITKSSPEVIKHFFKKINDVVIDAGISKTGFKILANSGKNGGQEVPHFHIHILGGEKIIHLK